MNIYESLLAIQTKVKAPKNQYNQFGDFYYRNAEDIQEALKPLLAEQNVSLILSDNIEQIGDRYYVTATATLFNNKLVEDKVSVKAYAREPLSKPKMDEAQVTGSASSYARKYALCGLFLLDDTKDADSMGNTEKEPQKARGKATQQNTASREPVKQSTSYSSRKPEASREAQNKRPTERFATLDQLETIRKELVRTGVSEEAIMDRYHISGLGGLTERDAADAIKGLAKSKSVGFDAPLEDDGNLPWA